MADALSPPAQGSAEERAAPHVAELPVSTSVSNGTSKRSVAKPLVSVQVDELPVGLKLRIVRAILPMDEGIVRKVVEYCHQTRRNPTASMRILLGMDPPRCTRLMSKPRQETGEVAQVHPLDEQTLRRERMQRAAWGYYTCAACELWINGHEAAEEHINTKKHRKRMKQNGLSPMA